MNAIQFRLTEMWLIALCPEQELGHRLSPAARAHIEQVLGDEYRMQANLIREELRHAEAA